MNIPAPAIAFEETEIEIGCTRRGRPSYRRARAFFVIIDGVRQFPPMQIREAKRYAKQVLEGGAL